MKYRAVVVGLTEDGHPIQEFSSNLDVIRIWAKEMATKKSARVRILALTEVDVESVLPTGPETTVTI